MDGLSMCKTWLREAAADIRHRGNMAQSSYIRLTDKTTSYANAQRVLAARLLEASKVLDVPITDFEWSGNVEP